MIMTILVGSPQKPPLRYGFKGQYLTWEALAGDTRRCMGKPAGEREGSQLKMCCEGLPEDAGAQSQGKLWHILDIMPPSYSRREAA